MKVISITRPTINPSYMGHITTTLYEDNRVPWEVLDRIAALPNELSWMEVLVGHLKDDPHKAIAIQIAMEKARVYIVEPNRYIPSGYVITHVYNYPGPPLEVVATSLMPTPVIVYKPQPTVARGVGLRLVQVIKSDGSTTFYCYDELPVRVQERIRTLDTTDVGEMLFGDVKGEAAFERRAEVNDAILNLSRERDRYIKEGGVVVATLH